MIKHNAYVVEWNDSASNSGWRSKQADHSPARINSVGWLIRQDKQSITITTSVANNGDVMDAISIPRKAMTKLAKLKQYVRDGL